MAGVVFSETYHALEHSRFSLQEETITEMLLLRLSRRLRNTSFDFRAFTKNEEGLVSKNNPKPTGADFEFWFRDDLGNLLKLRVQAKRQFPSGRYDGLDPSTKQISFLMHHCGGALPIYLFYNIKDKYDYSSAPKYPSGQNFASPSYWGCSYAMASDVLSGKKSPEPRDFLPDKMWPWHTLVCDYGAISSLPERVNRAIIDNRSRSGIPFSIRPSLRDTSDLIELGPTIARGQELPSWFDERDGRASGVRDYLEARKLDGVVILNQKDGG